MGFFNVLDVFKVQQSFYLYNQEKKGKQRKYSVLYGSILGFILTVFCFSFLSFYLYSMTNAMLSGKNDKLRE